MQSDKVLVIVQGRMGSDRLPGKMLKNIKGRPVIAWVVSRIKAVKFLDKKLISDIVVATSTNPEDDDIERWCKENKVKCFRGHPTDVLERFYKCAKKYKAKWILRICGDCPLLSPLMVYGLLSFQPRKKYSALAFNTRRIPGGWDAELFSMSMLKEAFQNTKPEDREHVTKYMRSQFEDFLDFGTDFNFSRIKLDLDTPEDYERICNYAQYL